jgi:hypothetical protein
MKKQHEMLLVATLAGLVIAGAATFAVQPAMAAGYGVDAKAQVTGVAKWDQLNMRKWPAAYSRKVGALEPEAHVWVERCIVAGRAPTGALSNAALRRAGSIPGS